LELDAIFRPLGFVQSLVLASGERRSVSPATVVTWQFPVLAKYRLVDHGWLRPVVMGGPSFRLAGNLNGTWPGKFGVTAGLGLEVRKAGFVITPAARYTRWSADSFPFRSADTKRDQVELVVEVHSAKDAVLHSRLSLGLMAGTTLGRDLYRPGPPAVTGTRAALFGPALSFRLNPRWDVEASALQHPYNASGQRLYSTWEVPVLARYRFGGGPRRLVIGEGLAYRLPQEINGSRLRSLGFVVDGGYEIPVWRVKVTPRLRYTRWLEENGTRRTGVDLNQMALLLGVQF
jgi:hypothetical protein